MKRLYVQVAVEGPDRSIRFHHTLSAIDRTVTKSGYAKRMLDDPRVNLAISTGAHTAKGIEHPGLQVEDPDESAEVHDRLKAADRPVLDEEATTCCYAGSERSWIADPQGVVRETFYASGEAVRHGTSPDLGRLASDDVVAAACCAPIMPVADATPGVACCEWRAR